jgi:hypothetical protein
LSVGRLRLSFLYRLLTLTRGPDTIFFWIETCFPQILYLINDTKKF